MRGGGGCEREEDGSHYRVRKTLVSIQLLSHPVFAALLCDYIYYTHALTA